MALRARSGSPGTVLAVSCCGLMGLRPGPSRSRNVIGSRIAGARRAADLRECPGPGWRSHRHAEQGITRPGLGLGGENAAQHAIPVNLTTPPDTVLSASPTATPRERKIIESYAMRMDFEHRLAGTIRPLLSRHARRRGPAERRPRRSPLGTGLHQLRSTVHRRLPGLRHYHAGHGPAPVLVRHRTITTHRDQIIVRASRCTCPPVLGQAWLLSILERSSRTAGLRCCRDDA